MTQSTDLKEGALTRDTVTNINANFTELFSQGQAATVAIGSTRTMTTADAGKLMLLDTATGSVATLPASTGSGNIYKFVITTVATSNSHIIKVANASDAMQGLIFTSDDTSDGVAAFRATAGTSDTITLNRTTTGSIVKGETIVIQDISTNVYQVLGFIANTGTPATPFSATV